MKLLIQPVECRAHVFHFAPAVVVLAFAHSGAAKIEPQDRKPKAIQSFHRMVYDLVVQCATIQRMRMADQRGMGRIRLSLVEQRFQTAGRAVEEQTLDAVGHSILLPEAAADWVIW